VGEGDWRKQEDRGQTKYERSGVSKSEKVEKGKSEDHLEKVEKAKTLTSD